MSEKEQQAKVKKPPPPLWKHFAAGTGGGVFGLTLAYPLDTIKVRMQTRKDYKGLLDCGRTILRQEGAGAFYRGLLSPVIGYGIINATAFGSYNTAKKLIRGEGDPERNLSLTELVLAGGAAGFVQSFVRVPIEQIKVVMQARNKPGTNLAPYSGSLACARDILAKEGLKKGFYRGLPATIGREMPQYGIYYPAYELCKLAVTPAGSDPADLTPPRLAFAGGIAGVSQWLPTYWIDVVKSKVQAAEPGTYRGLLDCAAKSFQAEGASVFFRGISAALIRAFPLHGAVFVGYETSMKLLNALE